MLESAMIVKEHGIEIQPYCTLIQDKRELYQEFINRVDSKIAELEQDSIYPIHFYPLFAQITW